MLQRFSMLDLSPIAQGQSAGQALRNTLDLARHAETQGYHRFWLAEHHNMPGIASSATAVMIGQVAAATTTIRVGAGGIMLPNHAPLMVAEQFGTLAELFKDRIDLGLGRAPGTDMATAKALRKSLQGAESFPQEVVELLGYLGPAKKDATVRAIPGEGTDVPVWILGSSLAGAHLAAHLGLPYAFASHFAPDLIVEALNIYRTHFQPSRYLSCPYVMIAAGVCAADTDHQASVLRSSQVLAFANLRMGRPGKLPPPVDDLTAHLSPQVLAAVDHAFAVSAVGAPQTVRRKLAQIVDTYQPDEIMLTGMIYDHDARVRSFGIAAEVLRDILTDQSREGQV